MVFQRRRILSVNMQVGEIKVPPALKNFFNCQLYAKVFISVENGSGLLKIDLHRHLSMHP